MKLSRLGCVSALALPLWILAGPAVHPAPGVIDLAEVGVGSVPGVRIDGAARQDEAGRIVAGAGDFNGDGFEDFMVATRADPDGRVDAGVVHLVLGAEEIGTAGVLRLAAFSAGDGVAFWGRVAGDDLGSKMLGAGDVDGDGFSDLLLGANFADPRGREDAGETHLVFGTGEEIPGLGIVDLAAPNGVRRVRFDGVAPGDRSGVEVSGGGDVNGDGRGDFLIGSAFASPIGRTEAGQAHLVQRAVEIAAGADAFDLTEFDEDDGTLIVGPEENDRVHAAWGVGDVNGDGLDDLCIPDPLEPLGDGTTAARVYIVHGDLDGVGEDGIVDLALFPSNGGTFVEGIFDVPIPDMQVFAAGDVNGDGFSDVIAAVSRADVGSIPAAGQVFVLFGSEGGIGTDGLLSLNDLTPSQGVRLDGYAPNDQDNYFADSAGDVDGDGFADLIIGARTADRDGQTDVGEAFLVLGSALASDPDGVMSFGELDGTNGVRYRGSAVGDQVGRGVMGAGDVNADGLSDFVIGARGADPDGQSRAGRAYLVYGQGDMPSATYRTHTRQGNAPRRGVGMTGDGSHSIPFSRCWIGFDGGEGPGNRGASLQTVTLLRSNASVEGLGNASLSDVADVMWRVETDRTGHASMEVTLKYLDSEIAGLDEAALHAYQAPSPEGPWRLVWPHTLMTERNQIRFEVPPFQDGAGHFALAEGPGASQAGIIDLAEVGVGSVPGVRIDGVDASDRSGVTMSGAGDVNGDGLEDLLIGTITASPQGRFQAGESYLVLGSLDGIGAAGVLALASLSGPDGTVIQGVDPDGHTGWVRGGGDVNGDGFADMLFSGNQADTENGSETGEIHFIPGSADHLGTDGVFDLADFASVHGARIPGLSPFDHLVWAAGAGDVNSDGYGDVLLGAINVDHDGQENTGASYLIWGEPEGICEGSVLDLNTLDGNNGVRLDGFVVEGWSGHVNGLGDINSDGYDDFATGAHTASFGDRIWAGELSVVLGTDIEIGTDGVLDLEDLGGGIGLRYVGPDGGRLGHSVAGVGDVNGDGHADFLIGAFGTPINGLDEVGRAYLIWGDPQVAGGGTVVDLASFDPSLGVVFNGFQEQSDTGFWVAGAGDVNGDGLADVLIGAETGDSANRQILSDVFLIFGSTEPIGVDGVFDLSTIDGITGVRLREAQPGEALGRGVSAAGDVNGDGWSDFALTSFWADTGTRSETGRTYLIYGGPGPLSATHRTHTRWGNAPRRGVGMTGDGSHSIPFSRCWIDYVGGFGPGNGFSSLETVTLTRSGAGIAGLADAADVMWSISTDRMGSTRAQVTLKSLDREIEGLDELALRLFQAPSPAGPWTPAFPMGLNLRRNQIIGSVPVLSETPTHFALAAAGGSLGVTNEEILGRLLGLSDGPAFVDVNHDGRVDVADLEFNIQATSR